MATFPIVPIQVTKTVLLGNILAALRAFSEIKNSELFKYLTLTSQKSLGLINGISLDNLYSSLEV